MDIILFGMQGSGKGTQGKILAEKYGLRVFEMGAELRKAIESGTELGQKIKQTVESGNLVDDQTIIEVVEAMLKNVDVDQPILFDGIPRTAAQSQELLKHLTDHGRNAFAVYIKLSEEEAIRRLTSRRVCSQCKSVYPAFYDQDTCSQCGGKLITRHDDNLATIQKRLENFNQETLPVIKQFYDVDRLIEVDGEQSIEDVTAEMVEKVAYLFT